MTVNYRPPARVTVKAGGRGSGKTYTAVQWTLNRALENRGTRIAMIGSADRRNEFIRQLGEAAGRAGVWVDYRPVLGEVSFENGSVIVLHDSKEPDRLRGPHYKYLVGEHVDAWPEKTYQYAKFACRSDGKDREQMFFTFLGTESERILDSLSDGFEGSTI